MAQTTFTSSYGGESEHDRSARRRELARTLAKGGMTGVQVISHEDAEKVLTPKRREIIEALRVDEFSSVRDLAEALDRDEGQVSRDLKTLAKHGVVDFEKEGRGKRPYIQHDHLVVEPIV